MNPNLHAAASAAGKAAGIIRRRRAAAAAGGRKTALSLLKRPHSEPRFCPNVCGYRGGRLFLHVLQFGLEIRNFVQQRRKTISWKRGTDDELRGP